MTIYPCDQLIDFRKDVKVVWNENEVFYGLCVRELSVVFETRAERYDTDMFYSGRIDLKKQKLLPRTLVSTKSLDRQ